MKYSILEILKMDEYGSTQNNERQRHNIIFLHIRKTVMKTNNKIKLFLSGQLVNPDFSMEV